MVAAGRTDAGVHATGQVASFKTQAVRTSESWRRGANSLLARRNAKVAITWVASSADASGPEGDFHARFSARYRRYLYLLDEQPSGSPLSRGYVTASGPLQLERMNAACRHLGGEQDFSSLRASGCQSATPWRCVHHVRCRRVGRFVVIDVQANAFLLHMVRNLTGLLLAVSSNDVSPDQVPELMQKRDRSALPKTAPADGLYLAHVGYDQLTQSVLQLPPLLGALATTDALL